MGAVLRKDGLVFGVDFDNTLISYDALAHALAREHGLIPSHFSIHKERIRDHIRQNFGDEEWQKIQAVIYGAKIGEAILSPGADIFLQECHRRKIPVHIVSHKTEVSNLLQGGVNFRHAALKWMEGKLFFTRLGVRQQDVHFASTRGEKVNMIQQTQCTHFIDDLEEVFHEPGFPHGVKKILYCPGGPRKETSLWKGNVSDNSSLPMNNWREIYDYFFS